MSKARELMESWLIAKEKEQEQADKRLKIEMELYTVVMEQTTISKEGTTNFEDDGLKLTITSRYNVTVDQEMAANHPELFKAKYEYSKTHNKSLDDASIKLQEEFIVVKPAKPTFAVKVL